MTFRRTMTPAEETAWAGSRPVPTKGHVIYLLHEGGLRWIDIDVFFGIGASEVLARGHDATSCWWCRNRRKGEAL